MEQKGGHKINIPTFTNWPTSMLLLSESWPVNMYSIIRENGPRRCGAGDWTTVSCMLQGLCYWATTAPSFFVFCFCPAKLSNLALNLWPTCLSLSTSWDYRHMQSCSVFADILTDALCSLYGSSWVADKRSFGRRAWTERALDSSANWEASHFIYFMRDLCDKGLWG